MSAREVILKYMLDNGLSNRDMLPFIGSRARVSEVLSGKRGLSLGMMRALNHHCGIPAADLLWADHPATRKGG